MGGGASPSPAWTRGRPGQPGRAGGLQRVPSRRRRQFLFDPSCLLARAAAACSSTNWAAENPRTCGASAASTRCAACAWRGCKRRLCAAYGLPLPRLLAPARARPLERLAPLAKAGVPIFHIHGDVDKVVPMRSTRRTGATLPCPGRADRIARHPRKGTRRSASTSRALRSGLLPPSGGREGGGLSGPYRVSFVFVSFRPLGRPAARAACGSR